MPTRKQQKEQLLAIARACMHDNVKTKTPYDPYKAIDSCIKGFGYDCECSPHKGCNSPDQEEVAKERKRMHEEWKNMLRDALVQENPEAATPGFDPLSILVHEYNNLIRKSLGEKEILLDIMSFSPVLTPWRKEEWEVRFNWH